WSHVTMAWNETTLRLYVNGELVGSVPAAGPLTGYSGAMSMGEGFQGALDEVVLYQSPLSARDAGLLFVDQTNSPYLRYSQAWFRRGAGETEVITPLPSRPWGPLDTPFAINEAGDAVGTGLAPDGTQHALLYTDVEGLRDLNDMLPASSDW